VNYISYLKNGADVENEGFLLMTTYGPFVTIDSQHMSWLGVILRDLLPYAATYQPPRELSPPRVPRTPSPVEPPPLATNPRLAGPEEGGKQRGEVHGLQSKRENSPLNPKSKGDSTSSDERVPVGRIRLPDRTSDGKGGNGDPSLRSRTSLGSLKDIQYGEAASTPAEQSTAQHQHEQERGRQQSAQTDSKKGKKKKK
jgi:hypothetical protein